MPTSLITVHQATYPVPATFDLVAVIAAVRSGTERQFVMDLPPHPHKVRNRRVVFTTSQIEAIEPDLVTDPDGQTFIVIAGVRIPYEFTTDDLQQAGLISDPVAEQHRRMDQLFGGAS